eukprot:evm.model.scf_261EXC.3 EVM.evm.TU.scf_261EXC.3   scf_261EXC:24511-28529(-)
MALPPEGPFNVALLDSDGVDLPFVNHGGMRYVAGRPGQAFTVKVSWPPEHEMGSVSFVLEVDGEFVGYTRVRDLLGYPAERCEVIFDGWMVSRGEVSSADVQVEYARFCFCKLQDRSDECITRSVDAPTGVGTVKLQVFEYERGEGFMSRRRTQRLWGSMASDRNHSYNRSVEKKTGSSLGTDAGETFFKTRRALGGRLPPGRMVGPPLETKTLKYDTAGALMLRGILDPKDIFHKMILDEATRELEVEHMLPSGGDSLTSTRARGRQAEVKHEFSHRSQPMSQERPSNYPWCKYQDQTVEVCDLTDEVPTWSARDEKPPTDGMTLQAAGSSSGWGFHNGGFRLNAATSSRGWGVSAPNASSSKLASVGFSNGWGSEHRVVENASMPTAGPANGRGPETVCLDNPRQPGEGPSSSHDPSALCASPISSRQVCMGTVRPVETIEIDMDCGCEDGNAPVVLT